MEAAVVLRCSATGGEEESAAMPATSWRDELRARALARRPHEPWLSRPASLWVLLVVIVFHLALLVELRNAMLSRFVPAETKIRVELLDLSQPEPALPQPLRKVPTGTLEKSPPRVTSAPPAAPPPSAALAQPVPRTLQLYNADGSLRIPSSPEFRRPPLQDRYSWEAIIKRNHNPLHCRKTDRASTEDFESLGDRIARNPVLQFLGLGNPLNQQRVQERKAAADAACDGDF
jgi:hypothetical protein